MNLVNSSLGEWLSLSAAGDARSSLVVKAEELLIGEKMIEPARLLAWAVILVAIDGWGVILHIRGFIVVGPILEYLDP